LVLIVLTNFFVQKSFFLLKEKKLKKTAITMAKVVFYYSKKYIISFVIAKVSILWRNRTGGWGMRKRTPRNYIPKGIVRSSKIEGITFIIND
jgi:hypothetical protein